MLYTNCILNPREEREGLRISVMSRHTLNDGQTNDLRIVPFVSYDFWLQRLAPSGKLVGDWYKNKLGWEDFEKSYLDYLRTDSVADLVHSLFERAFEENLSLLCIEKSPEFCHRRLLAEECQRYDSRLKIEHIGF